MTAKANNKILVVIAIALLTVPWAGEVVAVSQSLKDASFSIIDPVLFRSSSTPSPTSPDLQNFNPLSGFNRPVFLGGNDSLDMTTGIFHVNADGVYVFVIHRPGVDVDNPDLTLTLIPIAHPTTNQTLVTLGDTGKGNVITNHVVAELRSGDRVLIANPRYADVIGTEYKPFIYNAFLLYHARIASSPKVRQSVFSVTVTGNTSTEGVAFSNYDVPAVNINEDFNIESGTFLISLKGLYIFHLSATFMMHRSDGQPAVAISVNDVERARVQADVDMMQRIENVGVTIALPMVKGDIVQLINVFANPNIDCFATFAGYLLA